MFLNVVLVLPWRIRKNNIYTHHSQSPSRAFLLLMLLVRRSVDNIRKKCKNRVTWDATKDNFSTVVGAAKVHSRSIYNQSRQLSFVQIYGQRAQLTGSVIIDDLKPILW
ncbi:hypothetical protein FRX31_033479 [Thalictrum thalictroides]|uniref:Uncharacterized protein n=1 Tax=Thalictrum thalictroides TaxID=46969 RepID=A0A7J6UWD1_THATH|nr:hypothetical protein FRX31_033479 [Thalictrum thalictroides]